MGSRLHKIGSIYSRMKSLLLRKGESDFRKPVWFDVYTRFPPDRDPTFTRAVEEEKEVKEIFYPEDLERAKIQNALAGYLDPIDLSDNATESQTQNCIKLYNIYIKSGHSEEECLKKIVDDIKQKRSFDGIKTIKRDTKKQIISTISET